MLTTYMLTMFVDSLLWWPLCPADSVSSLSWQNSAYCLCSILCSPSRCLKTGAYSLNKGPPKGSERADDACCEILLASAFGPNSPVSSLSSRKNFWLKIKATPLISSTLASAVVFLLTKLAVMAIANFPRNSLRAKPVTWKMQVKIQLITI